MLCGSYMSPPRDKTACHMICISSIESDVYNKKKIQMFVVNMTFISSREYLNILYILHSSQRDSESPDQTIQMFCWLFWTFAVRIFHESYFGKLHIGYAYVTCYTSSRPLGLVQLFVRSLGEFSAAFLLFHTRLDE